MRRSPLPKILVHRSELGEPPDLLGEVWAVVTDAARVPGFDAPHFPPDQVSALLAEAGRQHGHLCPGQVLGVRMAILGCERLGIFDPKSSKRLIVFVETDRCGPDAVPTVTGCTLGKRTLKFVDYGKLAATFLDMETGRAVRVATKESSREAGLRL